MIFDEMAEMARSFREMYTISDHSLKVSLSDDIYEMAREQGLLNAEGDKVLVEGLWIRIDGGARKQSEGVKDILMQREIRKRQGGGAKCKAPTTGPRQMPFTRRGKGEG